LLLFFGELFQLFQLFVAVAQLVDAVAQLVAAVAQLVAVARLVDAQILFVDAQFLLLLQGSGKHYPPCHTTAAILVPIPDDLLYFYQYLNLFLVSSI